MRPDGRVWRRQGLALTNCLPRPPGAGVGSETPGDPMDGHGVGNVPRTSDPQTRFVAGAYGHHRLVCITRVDRRPDQRFPRSGTVSVVHCPLILLPTRTCTQPFLGEYLYPAVLGRASRSRKAAASVLWWS